MAKFLKAYLYKKKKKNGISKRSCVVQYSYPIQNCTEIWQEYLKTLQIEWKLRKFSSTAACKLLTVTAPGAEWLVPLLAASQPVALV